MKGALALAAGGAAGLLVAAALPYAAPAGEAARRRWRAFALERRRGRVAPQWPQALLFLGGAVAAGATLGDALDHLSREAPEPLRSHLARAGADGAVSTEARVRRLLDDPSLGFARAALLLYAQTGGRVGRLLETAASVLQERIEAGARVKALTAQARASAWIVALTPFALAGALGLFAPELAAPLVRTTLGRFIVIAAFAMVAAGLALAQRLARVEA